MPKLLLALTLLSLSVTPLAAADLIVYSGGAPQRTLTLIAPAFEQETGHRPRFTFAVVGAIAQRLQSSEKADAVLLPVPLIDGLDKSGKLRADSKRPLARVGLAVVVRDGAPKPDISSADALRATLTKARSITFADPQATPGGRHVAALLARWNIAETPERKIVSRSAIDGGADAVAKGEIEIGVYLLSEMMTVKGITIAGMLPAELQNYVVYAGAIMADSAAPSPAADFIRFIGDPARRPQWQSTGFEAIGNN